jgi:hypothetical protein
MEDDTMEEVDFNNIPAPPNPNERVVYFNCPPLKIELGDVSSLNFLLLLWIFTSLSSSSLGW